MPLHGTRLLIFTWSLLGADEMELNYFQCLARCFRVQFGETVPLGQHVGGKNQ